MHVRFHIFGEYRVAEETEARLSKILSGSFRVWFMLIERLHSVIVLNHFLLLLAENRRNRFERVVEVVCLLLFLTPFRLFNRIIDLLKFDLFSW